MQREHQRSRHPDTAAGASGPSLRDPSSNRARMEALGLAHPPGDLGPLPDWVRELAALAEQGTPEAAAQPLADLALRDPVVPLPDRAAHEAELGADLSAVQVHAGPAASAACRALGAEAFTRGEHVVLGAERPAFETLSHELGHVLQGRRGEVPAGGLSLPGSQLEQTASSGRGGEGRAPDGQVMRASSDEEGGWEAALDAGLEVVSDVLLGGIPVLGPGLLAADAALDAMSGEQLGAAVDAVWPPDTELFLQGGASLGMAGPYVEGQLTQGVTNQGGGVFHVRRTQELEAGVLACASPTLKAELEAIVVDGEVDLGVFAQAGLKTSIEVVQAVRVDDLGDATALAALASQPAGSIAAAVGSHVAGAELVSVELSGGWGVEGELGAMGELDTVVPELVGRVLDAVWAGASERLGALVGDLARLGMELGVEIPVSLTAPTEKDPNWVVSVGVVTDAGWSAELLTALTALPGVPDLDIDLDGALDLRVAWEVGEDVTCSEVSVMALGEEGSGLGMAWDFGGREQRDDGAWATAADLLPSRLVARLVLDLGKGLGAQWVLGAEGLFGADRVADDWDGFGGKASGGLELELEFSFDGLIALLSDLFGVPDPDDPDLGPARAVLAAVAEGRLVEALSEATWSLLRATLSVRKAQVWVEAEAGVGATAVLGAGGSQTALLGLAASAGVRWSTDLVEGEDEGGSDLPGWVDQNLEELIGGGA